MARARGSNAVMAAAFESIYGTLPSTGYIKLPFTEASLGEEQGLIASDLLGYGREPLAPTRDVINADGDIVVPVDQRAFGHWLKLFLGVPATTANAGVSTHVFSSGATALPSMSVEVGNPEVPAYSKNFGLRGNTMAVRMERSGLLTARLGLVGQGETRATTSGAGTPTDLVIERFSPFQGNIQRDGAALASIVSADFFFSNNLDKIEVIRGDGRIEDADPGMVAMTGSIVTRFRDTTLLDRAVSGAPVALTFGWSAGANKSLTVQVPVVYLPKPKTPISGPNGVQVTFQWQASRDTVTGKTVIATLVNDVTSYA